MVYDATPQKLYDEAFADPENPYSRAAQHWYWEYCTDHQGDPPPWETLSGEAKRPYMTGLLEVVKTLRDVGFAVLPPARLEGELRTAKNDALEQAAVIALNPVVHGHQEVANDIATAIRAEKE